MDVNCNIVKIGYGDIGRQKKYIKEGAEFIVDEKWKKELKESNDNALSEIARLTSQEMPPKNFWHYIRHAFTCTSCAEDIRTKSTRGRFAREIRSNQSTLDIVISRVKQLNEESLKNRKIESSYGTSGVCTKVAIYFNRRFSTARESFLSESSVYVNV